MTPKIIDKGRIILIGMNYYGNPFHTEKSWSDKNEIGILWKRAEAFFIEHKKDFEEIINPDEMYEVHIESEETAKTGKFEVMIGAEVNKIENIPLELNIKIIPETTYAVFTLKGDNITSNWAEKIYKEWLMNSDYDLSAKYQIQLYTKKFIGINDPESEVYIYVPIKKK